MEIPAIELKYETETCTRCGGSGHYSYNEMWGSICFKCYGKKRSYTKRGAAAVKFANELREISVTEVSVGDRVYWGNGGRMTVAEISEPHPSGVKVMVGDHYVDCMKITITGQSGLKKAFSLKNDPLRREWTPEMIQQVVDFQESLTKAGKPRKVRT